MSGTELEVAPEGTPAGWGPGNTVQGRQRGPQVNTDNSAEVAAREKPQTTLPWGNERSPCLAVSEAPKRGHRQLPELH